MRRSAIVITGFILAAPQMVLSARGQEKNQEAAPGRLFSPIGTILVGGRDGSAWEIPNLFDDIPGGRELLALPGARGIVDIREGDVHLILAGNLPGLSAAPVLETAVVLHDNKSMDLDLTLRRGRIMIENHRKDGDVKVRVRTAKTELAVTLANKGAFIVESFGRRVSGASSRDAGAMEEHVTLLVIRGKAEVMAKGKQYALAARAALEWSGQEGPRGPKTGKEMPAWIDPGADVSARATAWHKAVEAVRRGLADRKSLASALAQAIVDKEPSTRTVALFSYGAIGDLDKVFAGLSEAKSADFRRAATLVLQHGLAHKADADRSLRALLNKKGWPAGEAETVIQLLLGAGELGRPETYQTLINYLQHDKLAVRELADRMLHSLVPQGKGISYDAAGSAEQRGRGQAEWRRLIPEGKLPR